MRSVSSRGVPGLREPSDGSTRMSERLSTSSTKYGPSVCAGRATHPATGAALCPRAGPGVRSETPAAPSSASASRRDTTCPLATSSARIRASTRPSIPQRSPSERAAHPDLGDPRTADLEHPGAVRRGAEAHGLVEAPRGVIGLEHPHHGFPGAALHESPSPPLPERASHAAPPAPGVHVDRPELAGAGGRVLVPARADAGPADHGARLFRHEGQRGGLAEVASPARLPLIYGELVEKIAGQDAAIGRLPAADVHGGDAPRVVERGRAD